jgi:outer membrane lipoprotein SlyB
MKKLLIGILSAIMVAGFVGCQTPEGRTDRTATGALAGGALGAGTGALIGNYAGHHTAGGAAIGGILGALAGGVIGHGMDSQQRDLERRASPAPRMEQGQPIGIADVKAMSKAGISDEVMISHIRNSRTVYRLTTAEIIDLKDAGVSQKVIDFMINTQSLYPPSPMPPRY